MSGASKARAGPSPSPVVLDVLEHSPFHLQATSTICQQLCTEVGPCAFGEAGVHPTQSGSPHRPLLSLYQLTQRKDEGPRQPHLVFSIPKYMSL